MAAGCGRSPTCAKWLIPGARQLGRPWAIRDSRPSVDAPITALGTVVGDSWAPVEAGRRSGTGRRLRPSPPHNVRHGSSSRAFAGWRTRRHRANRRFPSVRRTTSSRTWWDNFSVGGLHPAGGVDVPSRRWLRTPGTDADRAPDPRSYESAHAETPRPGGGPAREDPARDDSAHRDDAAHGDDVHPSTPRPTTPPTRSRQRR